LGRPGGGAARTLRTLRALAAPTKLRIS